MKASEIVLGGIYHDGKEGVREVTMMSSSDLLEYRILAAKVKKEYSAENHGFEPVIGKSRNCTATYFATWAKVRLSQQECEDLLLQLEAASIKLSPGEKAFMASAYEEAGDCLRGHGQSVTYDHTEGRAVAGLEKKGLLTRNKDTSEATFTKLGAAWFRRNMKSHVES